MTAREERRRWAYTLIRRCHVPPPAYGSQEWADLPEKDARRIAAVVVAAEAWATTADDLEATLRAEVEALSHAHKAIDDEEYVARQHEHRKQWRGLTLVRGAYADSDKFRSGGESA